MFISYASEDKPLAAWLAMRLISEGYMVWMDGLKLLGGESYPVDIDDALKNETAYVLALVSRHSIKKPNPLKERTLALNIAKERGCDFLIPLNVDGLSSTELDWMISDITFIPFYESWAVGFQRLLKKLESLGIPRTVNKGSLCNWFTALSKPEPANERLWSNLLPVIRLPEKLIRVSFDATKTSHVPQSDWIHCRQGESIWSFAPPPEQLKLDPVDYREIDWNGSLTRETTALRNIVTFLVSAHLVSYFKAKGMGYVKRQDQILYFKTGQLEKDELCYVDPRNKKKRRLKVVGERFRSTIKCHVGFGFRLFLLEFPQPLLAVTPSLVVTDRRNQLLPRRRAFRLERYLRSRMYNEEWLDRLLAITYWMSSGSEVINVSTDNRYDILISTVPLTFRYPSGVYENEALPDDIGSVESIGTTPCTR